MNAAREAVEVVLGVDAGGTKVAVAPLDRRGHMLRPAITQPSRTDSTSGFITGLEATLRSALTAFADLRPQAVGLACAGTVDPERGVVVTSPNLPLENVELAAVLERSLALPVTLENDANAGAWGETVVGAAAGSRHVVMLTLGTGVGGGLILDGRLYHGFGGGAAELGHTIVCAGGELCACGARGCLEMYASGKALQRYASARAGSETEDPRGSLARLVEEGRLDGKAVSDLAREGYPGASAAVRELGEWLGVGLVSMTNIFNPEIIVVGGGVSSLGELILEPARAFLGRTAMLPNREQVRVVQAVLGNDAGLVGGGLAAWERLDGTSATIPTAGVSEPRVPPGAGVNPSAGA